MCYAVFLSSFAEISQNILVFTCLNNYPGLLAKMLSHIFFIKICKKKDDLILLILWLHIVFEFVLNQIKPQIPTVNQWLYTEWQGLSLHSALRRAVRSWQHLDVRFRALRRMGDWRLRMNGKNIIEDSSRAPFLLPGKRKVNIKYSWNNFV